MLFNYYQLLGVKTTASSQEIKTAYRSLVKKYHPDKTLGDKRAEEYIKKIIEAYSVLINIEKRKNYDLKLAYSANAATKSSPHDDRSKNNNKHRYYNPNRNQNKTTYKAPIPAKMSPWAYVIVGAFIIFITSMCIKYSHNYQGPGDEKTVNSDRLDLVTDNTNTGRVVRSGNSEQLISASPNDSTGYYPYFNYFGKGRYADSSKTIITVTNNTEYDAVLFLLNNKAPNEVIRNHYLKKGMVCYLLRIPNGVYFIRAYFGKNWNVQKYVSTTTISIKGRFSEEMGYFQFNRSSDLFTVNREQRGKNSVTTNYETSLKQLLEDPVNTKISAGQFWKVSISKNN